jgi:hypothetical protein
MLQDGKSRPAAVTTSYRLTRIDAAKPAGTTARTLCGANCATNAVGVISPYARASLGGYRGTPSPSTLKLDAGRRTRNRLTDACSRLRACADQPGIEHRPRQLPPLPTFTAIRAALFNQLHLQSESSCRYRGHTATAQFCIMARHLLSYCIQNACCIRERPFGGSLKVASEGKHDGHNQSRAAAACDRA